MNPFSASKRHKKNQLDKSSIQHSANTKVVHIPEAFLRVPSCPKPALSEAEGWFSFKSLQSALIRSEPCFPLRRAVRNAKTMLYD
jgi:hypothetical protein